MKKIAMIVIYILTIGVNNLLSQNLYDINNVTTIELTFTAQIGMLL